MPQNITETITIYAPAGVVFNFTINPGNTPKWVDGIIVEKTNEKPTRLGTLYKNQGKDGETAQFEISAFKAGMMFEMTKTGDSTHIRYTFNPVDTESCELTYAVRVDSGYLSERFSKENIQNILQKLKATIENEQPHGSVTKKERA